MRQPARAPRYEEATGYLRLDQNTNPRANPALAEVNLEALRLEAYGSPDSARLRGALAERHGVEPEQVAVANGSDQVMDVLLYALASPGDIVASPEPSFEMYPFYCALHGLRAVEVPLGPGFRLPVKALLGADAAVTIVASPNNPTGNAFPPSDLEALIEGSRGAVILDAAYAEYAGSDYSSLVRRYDNVAVMGTFSKAHGLAGLRVGYVLVPQALAGRVAECRPPYALSTVAEAVALASLRYQEFVRESVALALDGKAALSEALTSMGFNVYPSDANFLLARPPVDALQLQSALRSRGILVRAFPDRPGLRDHLRITVGLPSHQERLLAELKAILGGGE